MFYVYSRLYYYSYFQLISGTIHGFQITTGDVAAYTKKNIVFVTAKPETKTEFQAILVGLGAMIGLFLFIIIIQLCKKSKSAVKRNVSRQSSNDISLYIEPQYQGNQGGYNAISELPKDHVYTEFESHYAEITDSLESNIPDASYSHDNYDVFYSSSSMTDTYSDTMNAMNGDCVEDLELEPNISVHSSNSYLQPIFVPRLQITTDNEQQENVFINMEKNYGT